VVGQKKTNMKVKFPLVVKKEGESSWTTYLKRETMVRNNSINLIVTGKTGSGKSWSVLSQCCKIDLDFDVNEQCFFHPKKLLRYFASGKIVKGKPFIFDEAGVKSSAQEWWSDVNKGLSAFFQTSRSSNPICCLTVPYIDMVSKGVRTLMNCHWRAVGYSKREGKSHVLPYVMEYNGEMSKFYRKRLLYRYNGRTHRCSMLKLSKPPTNKVRIYEKMKEEMKTKLYEQLADKMEAYERKESAKGGMIITEKQEQVIEMIREGKNQEGMALELGCTRQNISNKIRALRDKGIKITPCIDKNGFTTFKIDENVII